MHRGYLREMMIIDSLLSKAEQSLEDKVRGI